MSLQTRLTALVSAIGADIKDLQAKAGAAVSITQEGWHVVGAAGEPAFTNGNSWYGAFEKPSFMKAPDGRVMVRGVLKGNGTAGSVFTLPVGYRPAATRIFSTRGTFGAGNVEQAARIDVGTDGTITPQTAIPAGGYLTLEFEFDTGQTTFPASLAMVPQEGWHYVGTAGEPAFQNGFANQGGATRAARYRKDPAGYVTVEADVSSAAGAATDELTVFTLPVGYRPDIRGYDIELSSAGAAGGYAYVDTNGNIVAKRAGVGVGIFIVLKFWVPQAGFPASVITVTQEGWHTVGSAGEPAFAAGWDHFTNDGSQVKGAFRKDPAGRVYLNGIVSKGAGSTNDVFTLPPGYRPVGVGTAGGLRFPVVTSSAGGVAFVQVFSSGLVQAIGPSNGAWIDLSGITFSIGQTTFPAGKSVIPVVTALPPGATDGDEIFFQSAAMATDGVMWHLRYNAASASIYKWEYIGGGPIYKAGTATDWNVRSTPNNSSNAYIDATAPQITVPLAGEYEAEGNASAVGSNATASPGISLEKSGVTPNWNTGDSLWSIGAAAVNTIPVHAYKRILAVPLGANIIMWYVNANIGGAISVYNARLRIKPIRVG